MRLRIIVVAAITLSIPSIKGSSISNAENSCPTEMASIDGLFCIDKHEASLYVDSGDGSAWEEWSPFIAPSKGKKYYAASRKGVRPQSYITGTQARDACQNVGKRLCTQSEWSKACRGPANTTYPYGTTYQSNKCNEHDKDPSYPHPVLSRPELKGSMSDPSINQKPNTLAATGSYGECTNSYGVYDMVGNLHEWISDKTSAGMGMFKGGFYADTVKNGPGCNYTTTRHAFEYYSDYSIGFRCCK